MPVNERQGPGAGNRLDDRGQVGDLEIGGVGLGVPAVAAAAPVVGADGEPAGQARGRDERLPVAERAEDDDQGRSVAGAVVGDDGAVRGLGGFHLLTPCPGTPAGWKTMRPASHVFPARMPGKTRACRGIQALIIARALASFTAFFSVSMS